MQSGKLPPGFSGVFEGGTPLEGSLNHAHRWKVHTHLSRVCPVKALDPVLDAELCWLQRATSQYCTDWKKHRADMDPYWQRHSKKVVLAVLMVRVPPATLSTPGAGNNPAELSDSGIQTSRSTSQMKPKRRSLRNPPADAAAHAFRLPVALQAGSVATQHRMNHYDSSLRTTRSVKTRLSSVSLRGRMSLKCPCASQVSRHCTQNMMGGCQPSGCLSPNCSCGIVGSELASCRRPSGSMVGAMRSNPCDIGPCACSSYMFFRGMNSEISLPAGSGCAERAAITNAISNCLSVHRTDFVALSVIDPIGSRNPLDPCGVCEEWIKKIQSAAPSFSIVTFTDAQSCRGEIVIRPSRYFDMHANDSLPLLSCMPTTQLHSLPRHSTSHADLRQHSQDMADNYPKTFVTPSVRKLPLVPGKRLSALPINSKDKATNTTMHPQAKKSKPKPTQTKKRSRRTKVPATQKTNAPTKAQKAGPRTKNLPRKYLA
eukprot:GHVT01039427.1.p1 GENE.GHVT01039427.1~~GHVT01039427.1.p1  ORF type:complete len:485 (+),score=21.57 GHVT01039427.1:406-1860(+)